MNIRTITTIVTLLSTILLTNCSKFEEEDINEKKPSPEDTYSGWHDSITVEQLPGGYLTIAEAAEVPVGEFFCIRGYILGSASRSLYNSIMAPPFESRSSLILADRIFKAGDTPGEYDPFYEDDLFPVSLNDYSDTKRALNLVDNPGHWHRIIYIYGRKTRYMGVPGMDTILKYEFGE